MFIICVHTPFKLNEEVTSCATELLLFVVNLQNISNSRHQTVAELINLVETLADRHIVTGSVRKVKMLCSHRVPKSTPPVKSSTTPQQPISRNI